MVKIKYIETKPIQQIKMFNSREEYNEFFEKRINEILEYTYANGMRYQDSFEYSRVLINKDGTPRKEINPKWLHTKKAQAKQKKNWKKYIEKKKKLSLETSYRRKKVEIEAKIDYWKSELKRLDEEHQDTIK